MKYIGKLKLYTSFIVFGSMILIFISIYRYSQTRIEILSDYRRLVSNIEALERLEYIPEVKQLSTISDGDDIFVGYASFFFPFGEIINIELEFDKITINSDCVTVVLSSLSFDDTFVQSGEEIDIDYPLAYEGGEVRLKVNNKYEKYDELLMKIQRNAPYEFDKALFTTKPKNIISLLLKNCENLYVYVKMLEIKNQSLKGWDVSLFETEHVKGLIQRLRAEPEYSLISVYDFDQKIMQPVVLQSNNMYSEDEIECFLASFRYHIDTIKLNHHRLPEIIKEAVSDFELEK